jgi:hypothetical protein
MLDVKAMRDDLSIIIFGMDALRGLNLTQITLDRHQNRETRLPMLSLLLSSPALQTLDDIAACFKFATYTGLSTVGSCSVSGFIGTAEALSYLLCWEGDMGSMLAPLEVNVRKNIVLLFNQSMSDKSDMGYLPEQNDLRMRAFQRLAAIKPQRGT